MRIAISGYFLLQPATGSGQYTASLIGALGSICRDELLIVCPGGTSGLAESLLSGRAGRWEAVQLSVPAAGDLGKLWFEQVGLPWACRSRRADLLHIPYLGPPVVRPCKTVVTIHDLIMVLFPETRTSPQARAYTRLAAAAARRADFVLADSFATGNDILRSLGIPREKLKVIYLGYDESFRPLEDTARLEGIRAKYALERDFLFYIGGLDWRKNLPRLLRAFSTMSPKVQLAVAGRPLSQRRASFPDLVGLARELGVGDRVAFLGRVPEEDKAALYSACLAFVFPSLYEGFGLTPLEAMACGAPVVCSNAGSLPEVVGEAALLFDPTDEMEMARALARVAQDPSLRERMRQAGLARAGQFSWRRTAEETLEVYLALARGGPHPNPLPGGEGTLRGPHPNPLPRGEGSNPLSVDGEGVGGEVAPTPRIWGDQGLSPWNTALRRARAEASGLEGRVLEVGCGAGRFTRALQAGSPEASFFGCDLDPRSLSAGRSQRDGVGYAAADVHELPYLDGRFRAVLVFDVLEHLREPRRALLELHRVLETGGLLHALVPCEGQPGSLHWLLGLLRLGGDLKERQSGHIQRFTRGGVLRLLAETGFQVERVTYSMHPIGQVRDILSYVEQEEWFGGRRGNSLWRLLMRLLWGASYLESNLLFKGVPLGAVALHVTALRKP